MRRKIIGLLNSFSQGKSGGDMVFIEIMKRIKGFDKIIITSEIGKKICLESGLKGYYSITTTESEFNNIIGIYLNRIIKALFLRFEIKENDVLLGSSDFLPDVLPIFIWKFRNRKAIWVQHVFHLIPGFRKIPFLAQKLSFLQIKLLADKIIVDNHLLKKELINQGFDENKIYVIYPGIDIKYLSLFEKSKISFDAVFLGQFRLSKGIFELINIWRMVWVNR